MLIESHKHYSLISNSGAAAGGWELPAAATEAVLEGIGPGGGEAGRVGRVFKGMNLTMGVYFPPPHPHCCSLFHGNASVWQKDNTHKSLKGDFRASTPQRPILVFHLPLLGFLQDLISIIPSISEATVCLQSILHVAFTYISPGPPAALLHPGRP